MSITRRLPALLSIVAALAMPACARTTPAPQDRGQSLRLSLTTTDGLSLGGGAAYPFGLALAADGRHLVLPGAPDGVVQLWLRDLSTGDVRALPGTTGAVLPFWAPDGKAIGFFADAKMRVLTLADSGVVDLADAPAPQGAVWHQDGRIVFAPGDTGGLFLRSPEGRVEPLTTVDAGSETSHRHPHLLNGGTHVAFFVQAAASSRQGIWMAPLDGRAARQRLVGSEASAIAVGGALLYSSGGALVAQPIDFEAPALAGPLALVGASVGHSPAHRLFATAGGEVLIFGPPSSGLRHLTWFDRSGARHGTVGEPMDAWDVRVAGSRIAVTRVDPQLRTLDVWTYEGNRPVPRRLSSSIDADEAPAFSRDGARLAWTSGRRTVVTRDAAAARPETTLRTFDDRVRVSGWSADARWIALTVMRTERGSDILLLPVEGDGGMTEYATSPFNETEAAPSPNGRWLAYASDESGRFEVYLDTFPKGGNRARLTLGGGREPRWSRDSRELFFRRGTAIHVVRPDLSGGAPEALSSERLFDAGADIRSFDVTADGQRFLLNVPAPEDHGAPLSVIVNLPAILPTLPAR